MQNQRTPGAHRPKISHVEVYWKTVTYRTVALYVLLILAVVMATLYLIYPEAYNGAMAKVSKTLGASANANAELTAKQAKFVNLDGKVQVKKVNSVQWVAADYRMALDKGDLIQTSGDGAARVNFADGTTYTVQADTLDAGFSWFTFMGGLSRMMFSFFCGVLIYRFRQPGKIHSSALALVLLALLLTILGAPHTKLSAVVAILLLFPAIVLFASSVEPGKALQRTFGLLGVTSYAVYALHKPLYQMLLGFLIIASPVRPASMAPWIGIGYLFVVFAGCLLVDRFYDAPLRQLLGGLQKKRRGSGSLA